MSGKDLRKSFAKGLIWFGNVVPDKCYVCRIQGVKIYLHITLLFVFLLMATGGLAGYLVYLAVILSVLAHEFGHIFAAKSYGYSASQVLLTPIGGIACIELNKPSAREELYVTIAGPLVNAVIFVVLYYVLLIDIWSAPVKTTLNNIMIFNAALMLFNSLPCFPMDGGRVLRALIKTIKPHWSHVRATQCTCWVCWIVSPLVLWAGVKAEYYGVVLIMPLIGLFAYVELQHTKIQECLECLERVGAEYKNQIEKTLT